MDHAQNATGQLESLAMGEYPVRAKAMVLALERRWRHAHELGPGACLEHTRCGRMVLVGMGNENPAYARAGRSEYRFDVSTDLRSGIDHRDIAADAQKIGIGAGTGHETRIGSRDAPNLWR